MGTYQQNFINAVIYEDNDENKKQVEELKQFVKEHSEICVRLPAIANGNVNYMMGWDGSKEGWETSDKYDEIRNEFVTLLKATKYPSIYSIIDGDFYEEPIVKCLEDDE